MITAGRTDIRVSTLDPLGADIPAGPGFYRTLLEKMTDAILSCLSP